MGLASYGNAAIQGLATDYPGLLRQELHDPEWRAAFLNAFKRRLVAGKRDAIVLYAKAVQLVDSREDLLLIIVRELGVRDKGELGALVTQGRKLAQLGEMTPESAGDNAVESLRVVIPHSSPETRRRWALSLAGLWNEAQAAEDAPGSTNDLELGSGFGPDTNGHGRAT